MFYRTLNRPPAIAPFQRGGSTTGHRGLATEYSSEYSALMQSIQRDDIVLRDRLRELARLVEELDAIELDGGPNIKKSCMIVLYTLDEKYKPIINNILGKSRHPAVHRWYDDLTHSSITNDTNDTNYANLYKLLKYLS